MTNPAFWQNTIRILALDPSLSCVGWALMEYSLELRQAWVSSSGKFEPCGKTLDDKLADAAGRAERIMHGCNPDILAIELPVVYRNHATTIKLAQLVGAIRWAAHHWTDRTIEIQPGGRLTALGLPMKMKRDIAKELVRNTVNALYKLDIEPDDHDISDAVAVAHAAMVELQREEWSHE